MSRVSMMSVSGIQSSLAVWNNAIWDRIMFVCPNSHVTVTEAATRTECDDFCGAGEHGGGDCLAEVRRHIPTPHIEADCLLLVLICINRQCK